MKTPEEIKKIAEKEYQECFRETGLQTEGMQKKMHIILMVNFYSKCQEIRRAFMHGQGNGINSRMLSLTKQD